jgi:hypothetical protein
VLQLRATSSYREWAVAAKELDAYLGNDQWREESEYAYYDSKTVRRVWDQIHKLRRAAEEQERKTDGAHALSNGDAPEDKEGKKPLEELKTLIEACVKSNVVGVENARLYSETYYGTKNLVQNFVDEGSYSSLVYPDLHACGWMLTCPQLKRVLDFWWRPPSSLSRKNEHCSNICMPTMDAQPCACPAELHLRTITLEL